MNYPKERCKNCHNVMELMERDYQFKGCEDRWYKCPHCGTILVVDVRYNRIVRKVYMNKGTSNDISKRSKCSHES